MPELTNAARADYARTAVEAYRRRAGRNPADVQQLVQDLLGDMQHFADGEGVDFELALQMGTRSYQDEIAEDEGQ